MDEVAEIKQRLPIEQVVGEYVPLKRAGRNFKGLSPFKPEKTPSFIVSPEKGIYKDFSSGEGGDIFDFVMKMDGLTFPEALKLLAEKAGVKLSERSQHSEASSGPSKQRIFSVNNYAARLWHTILMKHPQGEKARNYLTGRGLTEETIKNFQIGFAPAGDVTTKSLRKEEFTLPEIQAAGDPTKFRNRIVFPLHDITGKTIGFTGRILDESANGPKYWNTPETPVFHKSRALFGLHQAKHAIRDQDVCILVEGQMDVCMLHQHGFMNTVASSGTALTNDQLHIIQRFTQSIAIAYDQDSAGIAAAKKGIDLALEQQMNPFIIVVPEGKDPADCLQTNPKLWEQAYKKRIGFMSWLMDQAFSEIDELTPFVKKDLSRELIPWLAKVSDPIERQEWQRQLASRLQTKEELIEEALSRFSHKSPTNVRVHSETTSESVPQEETITEASATDTIAALFLTFPGLYKKFIEKVQELTLPLSLFAKRVFSNSDIQELSENERTQLAIQSEEVLAIKYPNIEMTEDQAAEEIIVLLARMRSQSKEELKNQLAGEIRQAEANGDTKRLQELFIKLKNLL